MSEKRNEVLDRFGIVHIDGKSLRDCTRQELITAFEAIWFKYAKNWFDEPPDSVMAKRKAIQNELGRRGYTIDANEDTVKYNYTKPARYRIPNE